MSENFSVAVMYALTPCHAGSGSALGVVDLPIQRERHTNWPMIQASGVKGAFRANFEKYRNNILEANRSQLKEFSKLTDSIFGTSDGTGYAGSSSFSDAKILAYPMRSNVSPFVWITCPSVLKRLVKDLCFTKKIDKEIEIPTIEQNKAFCINSTIKGNVLLEDFEVEVNDNNPQIDAIKNVLNEYLKNAERLLLVSDEVFNYGVTDCTQIMAQIKIDSKTGTTQDGSLRYQEELPSDTLMYSVIHFGDSKNSVEENLKAQTIKSFVIDQVIKNHIQIAGDETCGRGIFNIEWK